MATVTGLTAERMAAIEGASIIDGSIVGDDLILVKHNNAEINAGNVRGPAGADGIDGIDGATGPAGPDMDTKTSWTDDMVRPRYIKGIILDPSTVGGQASWRTYASASGLTLSSGVSTQDFTLIADDIQLVNQRVVTKFRFGHTTGMTVGNLLKVRTAALGILCYCDPATVYIYLGTSASGGFLAGPGNITGGALLANTDYWLESSIVDNLITSKVYDADPDVGSPVARGTITYTLLSTNATNLGTGRHGSPGIRAVPNVASNAFVNFRQVKMTAL